MNRILVKLFGSSALVVTWVFLFGGGCPSSVDSALDNARFALDRCNPSDADTMTFCNDAVTEADAILAADATNVEAAVIASSGRLGLAGVDFLQFLSELVGAQGDTTNEDLSEFADLITDVERENNITIDRTQLRSAGSVLETTLAGQAGGVGDLIDSAFFQMGAIQAVESFVLIAKVSANEFTDDDVSIFKSNAQNGDSNLSIAGVDDADTLSATREGHCRCKLADPAGGDYGPECLASLKICFIEDSGDAQVDFNGNGATAGDRTADCEALENPTGVETCKDENQ